MEHDKSINCENCGGTDFAKEGGFYFCTECQTQSQEIQERVFEHNDTVPILQKKVKIRKDSSEKVLKLTSWEIYNYILRGLVGELQELGVDDKFKEVTYHLWLKYLTKLECITDSSNDPPKLGVAYRKRDAEIVLKKKFPRKRKSSISSKMSMDDMDDRMKYAENRKHRKMMEKADYDTVSTTLQSDSQSLANQTLSGLSTDDESSIAGHIVFNKRSIKELLRHMTFGHLQLHMKDVNNEMTCHKMNRNLLSQMYYRGPDVLTRNKLYCLLYLSMLLTQQDLQISDMVRYCREGHLSFMEYNHFFPDTVNDNTIDHAVYSRGLKQFPTYEFLRTFTFKLYQYLELRPCNFSPNIMKLCRRYCTELNLPDQIFNIVGDIITKTRPFQSINKPTCIPNYEGRAIGFIIYILKVLLGLDDVTEYELSKFAHLVNKNNQNVQLFNFSEWFTYIEYRKTVLKHVHFPTWQLIHPDKDCPLDLFVKYTYSKKDNYVKEPTDLSMNVAKKLLTDVELLQDEQHDKIINFEPSLTPNRSYLEKLRNIENFQVLNEPLNLNLIKNTSKQSIAYLLEPQLYLKQINSETCRIVFNNAHPNHKFHRINPHIGEFFKNTYEHWEQKYNHDFAKQKEELLLLDTLMDKILDKHLHNVEFGPNLDKYKKTKPDVVYSPKINPINVGRNLKGRFCNKSDPNALSPEKIKSVTKSKCVSTSNRIPSKSEYNPSLLHQVQMDLTHKKGSKQLDNKKHLNTNSKYKYHYIPRMEYCSNIRDVSRMSKDKFKEFETTLPNNFLWLLKECARIIEQPTKDLFQEFVNVEVYMNYIYFQRTPVISKPLSNNNAINKMIKDVHVIW